MVKRVTFRRRHCYSTKSNKTKAVKTPGGRLVVHYLAKKASAARCGDCGGSLAGIPVLRPKQYKRLTHNKKTVTRAYGGAVCAGCVKQRIVRAFLIEEQKIVKKIGQSKAKKA
jgi:large subunit ribosomal protein L34e